MWLKNILRAEKSEKRKRRKGKVAGNSGGVKMSMRALRQLDQLHLRGSRELRGEAIGQRRSHRRLPASDFREHRKYVPGDDIRFVDWLASARSEQIYIRQGEHPQNTTVYLLMDCSGSMLWGGIPKNIAQKELAAALSYLALSNSDRLVIHPYGGASNQRLGPISGKGQMTLVLKYLDALKYGGEADLIQPVKRLSLQVSVGGLVFVLSDLLDINDLTPSLDFLPAPSWWVTILQLLHPEELFPDLRGDFEVIDTETHQSANYDITNEAIEKYLQHLNKWQDRLDMACVESHAFYTMISTGWSLEREMISHLRSVQVVLDK
jgi:uncharacterized protein (DUF58 family)